jgi:hypothetical protein
VRYAFTIDRQPCSNTFNPICHRLFKPPEGNDAVSIFDPTDQIQSDSDELAEVTRRLNAAFLILLAGQKHPDYQKPFLKFIKFNKILMNWRSNI